MRLAADFAIRYHVSKFVLIRTLLAASRNSSLTKRLGIGMPFAKDAFCQGCLLLGMPFASKRRNDHRLHRNLELCFYSGTGTAIVFGPRDCALL